MSKLKKISELGIKTTKVLAKKGPVELVRHINRYFDQKENASQSNLTPKHILNVSEILDLTYNTLRPLKTLYVEDKALRINLLIPALSEESFFGGAATAVIFSTLLAKKLDCSLRIISTDMHCDLSIYYKLLELYNIEAPKLVFSYDASWRKVTHQGQLLEVSENDLFISTIWWTSYLARNASLRKNFINFLQDFELVFYPNGDDRLLARESYSKYNDFLPLINTSNLFNHYKKEGFEFISKHGKSFEPAFPDNFYAPNSDSFKRKRKI